MKKCQASSVLCLFLLSLPTHLLAQKATDATWSAYGGDTGGTRFSSATQINKSNVAQLKLAWTFHTGALPHDPDLDRKATFESSISLVPESISVDDAWGVTPEQKQWCAEKIKAARFGSIYIPPSTQGTLVYPGNVGGVNWGSSAYDPANHLLIMNTNHLVMLVRMIPRDELDAQRKGASDLDRMHGEFARQTGAPFAMFRTPLLSASGLPCTAPPWGNVTAVDLFTGKKAWDVPLGTYLPGQKTGTINLGGLIATAGGLVFSAAGMDGKLHAFDSATGAELWSYDLPAGGQATPMTYTLNGKQYLVLAAGGHGKLGTKQGDSLLAFTLP